MPSTTDGALAIFAQDVIERFNHQGLKRKTAFANAGLSYTTFASSNLKSDGLKATFAIMNSGNRAGATVGLVYLVGANGLPRQRIVGSKRVELATGATGSVEVTIDQRLLANWNGRGWTRPAGNFVFTVGLDSTDLPQRISVHLPARAWQK